MKRTMIALLVAVLLLTGLAQAQTFLNFRPFRLLHLSALDAGGTPVDRYSVVLIEDQDAAAVCLAVVVDNSTGVFTATSVPAEACDARR